ncbi:MAG: hypothetical protein B1H08_00095 [Candidatus Omnitrophica bacterium 4484_171]|nr:MAG: hypothetical protein B1H08_00095 [Candidatus Omnitrophica bacterium 4484_171]
MKKEFDSTTLRFLFLIALLAIILIIGSTSSVNPERIKSFLKHMPLLYSSLAFVFLYVIGTFFIWYLKDPLKIVGAVVFGAYISTFLIYISEVINAFIFFNLSAILGKEFIEKKVRGKFRRFYEKLEGVNLGWIFLLRAVPLIPYRILDMSFGLSKVKLGKYIVAVLLASLPRIFWIQFILSAVGGFSMDKLMRYFSENTVILVLSFVYFIAALAAAFRIKRKFM